MKAIIRSICLLVLAAGAVAAQEPVAQFAQQIRQLQQNDPVGENLFPPEMIMKFQQSIGLQDAQKTAMRGEISKAQTRFTELQWQLQDAMESMVGMLKQDQINEEQVLAQLDKVLATEREIKRAQFTLMVRLKNKLTAEQQKQLREIRKHTDVN